MVEAITTWLQNTFTANPYWLTALVSVIPTIEVRGSITLAIGLGINPWLAWLLACVSSLIVCPLLLFCFVPILRLLRRIKGFEKLSLKIEALFQNKAKKLEKDATEEGEESSVGVTKRVIKRKFISIFLFVAIPLPLTGLWTGSAVAAFLDLDYKYSAPAIILGDFACGLIITLLNIILGPYASLIFIVLIAFAIISIISLSIALFAKRKRSKNSDEAKTDENNEKI